MSFTWVNVNFINYLLSIFWPPFTSWRTEEAGQPIILIFDIRNFDHWIFINLFLSSKNTRTKYSLLDSKHLNYILLCSICFSIWPLIVYIKNSLLQELSYRDQSDRTSIKLTLTLKFNCPRCHNSYRRVLYFWFFWRVERCKAFLFEHYFSKSIVNLLPKSKSLGKVVSKLMQINWENSQNQINWPHCWVQIKV